MTAIRYLTLVTILTVAATAWSGPASAVPNEQACSIDDISLDGTSQRLSCENDYEVPNQAPEPASTGTSGNGAPTGEWTRELWGVSVPDDFGAPGGAPVASADCVTDDGESGLLYRDTLRDTATGEVLSQEVTCVSNDTDEPEPPDPPAPPTAEELQNAAHIPDLEIVSDTDRGIIGLESRFWADDAPSEITASAPLRGWTVSSTLTATNWTWETGDGDRYTSSGPGSPASPAVAHVYERLPDQDDDAPTTWPVEVTVRWEGPWTIEGYGTEFVVDDLATIGSTAVDYEVVEVRGVLHEDSS